MVVLLRGAGTVGAAVYEEENTPHDAHPYFVMRVSRPEDAAAVRPGLDPSRHDAFRLAASRVPFRGHGSIRAPTRALADRA